MDFIRGGDLSIHISRKNQFPEDIVQFYAAQIVMALGFLHSYGIIYQNLKLENVLLHEDGIFVNIFNLNRLYIIS